MRKKLTPAFIKDAPLPAKGDRVVYWDAAMPGFGLVVTKNGTRSFAYQYRNALHQSRRMTWAARIDGEQNTGLTLTEAHKEAKKVAGEVEKGKDPLEEQREERRKAKVERRKQETAATTTLKAICEQYLTREGGMTRDADGKPTFAENRKLRSAPERLAVFERHLYTDKIAGHQIEDVKRSEINRLLDKVEDERGPQAAHKLLAFLSRLFNWHASRHDDFRSPIVRGMGRVKPRERAGKRILDDQEICDVWAATEAALNSSIADFPPCFAQLVRTLLLTTVRRVEAARMAWPEIEHLYRDGFDGDVWVCPASRMKGKIDHAVPLMPTALDIIGKRPTDAKKRPFVFSTDGGKRAFSSYSKGKRALDKKIAELRKADGREPMPPWQLSRDIRRTARSLLSRAGVPSDHAERVIAHVIPGVRGVYDLWSYLPEKRDALERLASLIDRIVTPPGANVLTFPSGNAAAAAG